MWRQTLPDSNLLGERIFLLACSRHLHRTLTFLPLSLQVLGFAIAWFSFGQRARIRSLLVDGHADISKRDARISCDNPDDPMLPSDSDEIRDMV